MKDGASTDNSYVINGSAGGGLTEVFFASEGIKNNRAASPVLRARDFYLQDKYGSTAKLRMQTSKSSSGNWKAKSVLLDKADYGALINLANKSRKVKSYQYYLANNSDPTNAGFLTGATLVNKPTGVPDPVSLSDISRAYVASNGTPTGAVAGATNGAAILTGLKGTGNSGLVVAPGGFAQNNLIYGAPYNYLIAEYGSLSEQQRKTNYVKKAAQLFVRSLAAYPANKNGVADRNAFTFGHDAQLNFNTSFTGKDKLNFRLRANTIYSPSVWVLLLLIWHSMALCLRTGKARRKSSSTSCTTSSQLVIGARFPWVPGLLRAPSRLAVRCTPRTLCWSSSTPQVAFIPL